MVRQLLNEEPTMNNKKLSIFALVVLILATGCASTPQSRDQSAFVQACVNDWFLNKDQNMIIEMAYHQARQVTRECKRRYQLVTAR